MNELYHYGVKGMKWGVRRYQNKNGSLTPKGVKRYAIAGYAQDSYNKSSRAGKVWNKITNVHKDDGIYKYRHSTDKQNKARAKKYVAEKNKTDAERKAKVNKAIKKGAAKTANNLRILGQLYLVDAALGGMGRKAVKSGIKNTGRLAVSLYMKARGGYDIRWYDN